MLNLPSLQYLKKKTKQYVLSFMGLNYTESHADGEFAGMTNLTSAEYPTLTQRLSRSLYRSSTSVTGLFARGHFIFVDGTTLYCRDKDTGELHNCGTVTAGEKQFACINTKLVIWPDKVYLDLNTLAIINLAQTATAAVTFASSETGSTIVTTGSAFPFTAGDGIVITGTTSNNKSVVIRSISADGKTLNCDASIFTAETAPAAVLSRSIPNMDYICEWNNRLWGCGGGKIYASSLGLPTNFNVFDGISTDSYAVAVGSDGDFTGCAGYLTHIIFFKEHIVHKIYGTKPANYEMSTGYWPGIKKGSSRSAVIINGVMYFHSAEGFVYYSGSIPNIISSKFGTEEFTNVRAAANGTDYVVSMQDSSGAWGMYVYDTLRGIWLRYDDTHALDMAFYDGHLYYSDASGIHICGSGTEIIEWSAELCRFDEKITNAKIYSRLTMRCELETGSTLIVSAAFDDGAFGDIQTITATERKVYVVPIVPTRCDSFRIKLRGTGRSRIYAITREYDTGSDLE